MLLMNRFGAVGAKLSMRLKTTALGGSALTFFDTDTRPWLVAAHRVDESLEARCNATTSPPLLSAPEKLEARAAPSGRQSPPVTAKSPVQSLQCWLKCAMVMVPS